MKTTTALSDDLITTQTENHALPDGYTARPVTEDDVAAVTALVNACFVAETGAPLQTEEEVLADWRTPGFHLSTDTLAVFTAEEQVAGYLEMWNLQEPPVRPFVWARVHPDHEDRGIGTYLLHWATDWSQRAVDRAPDGARVSLRCSTNAVNQAAQRLFEHEGFEPIRRFYRMVIEMDAPPPEPAWPEGITVRAFVDNVENHRAVHAAMEEAFSDHWGHLPVTFDKWLHWVENDPNFDPSLWYLAMDGDEIAGAAINRLKLTEDPDMGWVDDLAVRRPWRRRGIALALLHHAFGELYRRGQRKVGLGVDAQSLTGAMRLYEKAGMHIARHHVSFEKELRAGVELSTQTLET